MSMQIGVKDSFSESALSLHETIRKLTKERDSALHLVVGLEVQVLELGQAKEDAITAIFQKGIAALREEFSKGLKDQKKEFEEFKRLVAPVLVERQIRLEKEAAEKEAEEKEASLSFVPLCSGRRLIDSCKEKLRQGTLVQIEAFREHYEQKMGIGFKKTSFWTRFDRGEFSFPMEEQV